MLKTFYLLQNNHTNISVSKATHTLFSCFWFSQQISVYNIYLISTTSRTQHTRSDRRMKTGPLKIRLFADSLRFFWGQIFTSQHASLITPQHVVPSQFSLFFVSRYDVFTAYHHFTFSLVFRCDVCIAFPWRGWGGFPYDVWSRCTIARQVASEKAFTVTTMCSNFLDLIVMLSSNTWRMLQTLARIGAANRVRRDCVFHCHISSCHVAPGSTPGDRPIDRWPFASMACFMVYVSPHTSVLCHSTPNCP